MQDLANVTEGCNKQYGFRNESRLCHTCGPNFRRSGLHECKKCPGDNSINWLFIVLGALLAIGLLCALVFITIGEAGITNLSESMQKCILNYFQVAALFVTIPLRWPGPMQTLFDFQGAISTIGEHLVNPDCIATDSSAAELFYAKQLAFLIAPILLVITVFLLWRVYAWKTGKEWSRFQKKGAKDGKLAVGGGTAVGRSLTHYQKRRLPEVKALARLARFGAPYQYKQPHRIDQIRRNLWTANVVLRLLLSKLTLGLVPQAAIVLSQNPDLTFRQVMRRADVTTAGLLATLAAGAVVWGRRLFGA